MENGMNEEERKDYHLYMYLNNLTLKEGKSKRNYSNRKNNRTDNGQYYMEIQLTAVEADKYDKNKILATLTKYIDVLKKRTL